MINICYTNYDNTELRCEVNLNNELVIHPIESMVILSPQDAKKWAKKVLNTISRLEQFEAEDKVSKARKKNVKSIIGVE